MKALVCKNCGGSINPASLRCKYCGTQYERSGGMIRVSTFQGLRPELVCADCAVDNLYARSVDSPAELSRIIHSRITQRLAEALEPFVEYELQEDPRLGMQVVRGRVRVLPPAYRF